jgi:CubicO group peptidase (beta-lactamase class C family)
MKRYATWGLVGIALLVLFAWVSHASSDASLGFDLHVELLRRLGGMPSFSACIVKEDEVVWRGTWGWADIYRSVPASPETQYMIGSVSKMFTAVAILQLAEQGRFDLDDDVSRFLPFDLRNPSCPDQPITFRQLLSHHGSLAMENGHFFPTFYFRPYDLSELALFLSPDGADYRSTYWLDVCPGKQMEYANIGYELLAYLVERISGQSLAEYVGEHIFEPLGMSNSTYAAEDATAPAMPYMSFLGVPIPMGHYEIGSRGAGGIRTTLDDLSRFVIALMNGGSYRDVSILSPETIAEMQRVQYPGHMSNGFEYGLGWISFPGTDLGGHSGGAFGCRTMVRIRRSDRTAVLYTFNRLNPAIPPGATPLLNYAENRLDTILWTLAESL